MFHIFIILAICLPCPCQSSVSFSFISKLCSNVRADGCVCALVCSVCSTFLKHFQYCVCHGIHKNNMNCSVWKYLIDCVRARTRTPTHTHTHTLNDKICNSKLSKEGGICVCVCVCVCYCCNILKNKLFGLKLSDLCIIISFTVYQQQQ